MDIEAFLKDNKYTNDDVSEASIFEWITAKIKKGKYPTFAKYSDLELMQLARFIKPFINMQLQAVNSLVKDKQREAFRKDTLKKSLKDFVS